jgi:polyferredoxin
MFIGLGRYANIGVSLFKIAILFGIIYFFGNIFCGWVCHKGAVQEFLYRENFAIRVPKKLDNILKKFRYVFLLLIILYPIIKGHRIFNKIDPFKVLFNLEGTIFLIILLVILLVSSIFIYRPFCRYICPLGAFLGLINKIGLFNINLKKPEKCIHKNICEKKCPAQSLTMTDKPKIDKEYCFSCLECERRCPMHCLNCDKIF